MIGTIMLKLLKPKPKYGLAIEALLESAIADKFNGKQIGWHDDMHFWQYTKSRFAISINAKTKLIHEKAGACCIDAEVLAEIKPKLEQLAESYIRKALGRRHHFGPSTIASCLNADCPKQFADDYIRAYEALK